MTNDQVVATRVGVAPRGEAAVARVLADLARRLLDSVDDADDQGLLDAVARHGADLLAADSCAIVLTDGGGPTVLAAHPLGADFLEHHGVGDHGGPATDWTVVGGSQAGPDHPGVVGRWSTWSSPAARRVADSTVSAPLRTRGTVIGALTVVRSDRSTPRDGDRRILQALADVAASSIVHRRRTDAASALTAQLEGALSSRIQIEQAKGIVAHSLRVDVDRAFELLRYNARSTNVTVGHLAGCLVAGRVTADDLVGRPRAGRAVGPRTPEGGPGRRGGRPGR